jgi:hypothetical protein
MIEDSVAGLAPSKVSPSTIYLSGTGFELHCDARKDGPVTRFGVYVKTSGYMRHGELLISRGREYVVCRFTIHRQQQSQDQWVQEWVQLISGKGILDTRGWGDHSQITATTAADLGPYMVEGRLKVKATIQLVPDAAIHSVPG